MYKKIFFYLIILITISCNYQIDGKYYIMSYGVGKYGNYVGLEKKLPSLKYPPNDAYAFSRAFDTLENVVLYERYSVIPKAHLKFDSTSEAPTKEQFYIDLNEIKSKIGENDYFIFFYAGHGAGKTLFSNLPFDDYEEPEKNFESINQTNEYLCLTDKTGIQAPIDVLLSDNELSEALKQINTKKKIVFLDSCHSGGFIGKSQDFNSYRANFNINFLAKSFYSYKRYTDESLDTNSNEAFIMTAASEIGSSYELSYIRHGLFTHYFLKSLKYGDYNKDNLISLNESYKYIVSEMKSDIKNRKFKGLSPTFFKNSDVHGDQSTLTTGGPVDIIISKKMNFSDELFNN